MRGRMGKSKKTVEKIYAEALLKGKDNCQFKGKIKTYLDHLATLHDCRPIVYQEIVYITTHGYLITCWPIPQQYKKYLKEK